jgi:class 3 adenylate cyclase
MPEPTLRPGEPLPESVPSLMPLLLNGGYDPATNPPPELPGYPVYNALPGGQGYEGTPWGRTAYINIAYVHDAGAVLRWLATYVETDNEHFSRLYLHDLLASLRRTPGGMQNIARFARLDAPAGAQSFRLVADQLDLGGGQLLDIETEIATVPARVRRTFTTPAIEIILALHGLDPDRALRIDPERRHLDIVDHLHGDAPLHRIPLSDGQLMEVNWFSPWATPTPAPDGTLGALDEDAFEERMSEETPLAQQALARMRQAEGNGLHDPYNPRVSELNVVALGLLARQSAELRELIEPWLRRHFEGRVVLVGPTDPIIQDVGPTPFDPDPVPRVSVHGNALKTILSGRHIHRPPPWALAAITLLLSIAVSELVCHSGRRSRLAKASGVLLLMAYAVAAFAAFTFDIGSPLVTPVTASVATAVVGLGLQLREEEKRRARIKGMFATYLSPELVERMVESGEEPKLGGHTASISMFFSDIQNFSTFSELLPPAELTVLINEYLTPMTRILKSEGAFVDKYIGDAIVAMLNDPVPIRDHAYRACRAAARIQEMQMELREKWARQEGRWPALVSRMRTRIGINTGEATVGNMGSEDRFNYTMMGDNVNLAARCESGAKTAGVYCLVTEATRIESERHGSDIVFRYVDRWKVKGRSQPVSMYEIMGLQGRVSDEALECKSLYEEALRRYFARDFAAAVDLLERAAPLEPFNPARVPESPTAPSIVLLERCRSLLLAPPPEAWDGVFVMKTK